MDRIVIKNYSLPDKPSELINMALKNLNQCLKDDNYHVDMFYFHTYFMGENKCHVCLAGSVFAKTMKAGTNESMAWKLMEYPNEKNKLYALDDFRNGNIIQGLKLAFSDPLKKINEKEIFKIKEKYKQGSDHNLVANLLIEEGNESFKARYKELRKRMKNLASDFKKVGL